MKHILMAPAVAGLVLLSGCGKKSAESTQSATGQMEQKVIESFASSQVTIERLRKQKEIEWDKIGSLITEMNVIVKAVDAEHQTGYEKEIYVALEKCKTGSNPHVQQQFIAKGLQHVVVLAIGDLLKDADSAEQRKVAAPRVKAYFEGIKPTFVRRDQDFFETKPLLLPNAETALANLEKAADNKAAWNAARKQLMNAINHTYALCVLFEFSDTEKKRGSDMKICEKKMAEADVFYRIIKDDVKRKSPGSHEVIQKMLDNGIDQVDFKTAEAAMKKAFQKDFQLY